MKDEAPEKSEQTLLAAERLQILYHKDCLSSKVLLNAAEMIAREKQHFDIERIDVAQADGEFQKIKRTPVCRLMNADRVIAEHIGAMLPSQLRLWIRSLNSAEAS